MLRSGCIRGTRQLDQTSEYVFIRHNFTLLHWRPTPRTVSFVDWLYPDARAARAFSALRLVSSSTMARISANSGSDSVCFLP